ncbi:hypothetical protein EJB05_31611 [Eragrostis curvula]|uniref:Uncharacterized protein n=1 Tax=Eragrostis curvula TaxID=38414 RepID=A0A5J9UFG2_9POAL|nr:hypothetical protein EJB05_31611 [Eragrostis curvula]
MCGGQLHFDGRCGGLRDVDNCIYVFFIRFANGLFCTCQGMPWANLRLMAFGLSGDLFAAGSHCSSVMEQAHIFLFIRFGRTIA